MPSGSAKSRPVVLIVVFPEVMLLDVAGPMHVFAHARRIGGENYEIVLASANGGRQMTDRAWTLKRSQWNNGGIGLSIRS